jgi:site-specific DNA recombinase
MREVALVYVRKSMVRSKQDEQSPARQRALCIQECQRRGWAHEIYEDAKGHRSGRSERHRPAFRRLKAQLGRSEVQAVIVAALDRLSRSPKDFFNFLSLLQKHQVELISLREQFDTSTAIGKAFVSIIMIVAALESDIASERMTAALQYRRDQGIHRGNAPFGMSRNKEGTLKGNQDAEIVTTILELYAQGNYGFQALANYVNAIPFRFRDRYGRRRPFTRSTIRAVISNVLVYLGLVPAVRSKDMLPQRNGDKSRSLVDQMAELYQAVEGKIEPIITRDLAERVLSTRLARHELRVVSSRRVFILTPALHCHACGGEMRGTVHRGTAFYKHKKRSCRPGHGQHDAEALETQALDLFRGLALPPGLIDLIREKVRERLKKDPENEEVKQALDHLQGKMERLRELYIEGDLDREEYTTRRAELRTTIEEWIVKLGSPGYDVTKILDQLDDLATLLARGTPGQQKRMVNAVFARIEVGIDGQIKRAEPKPWFAPLFADLAATLDGALEGPRSRLEADQAARILALVAIIPRDATLSQVASETPRKLAENRLETI